MPAGGLITAAAISALPGLISGISSISGRKKRIAKNEPYQEYKRAADLLSDEGQINRELGQSYLQSTEGMALSQRIGQGADEQRRFLSNSADFSGVSDEARLAGLNDINEAEGQALAGLAGNADARRRQLLSQRDFNRERRLNALSQMFNMEQAIRGQNQAAVNTLGQGLSGAANSYLLSGYYQNPSSQSGGSAFTPAAQQGFSNLNRDFQSNVPRLGQMMG